MVTITNADEAGEVSAGITARWSALAAPVHAEVSLDGRHAVVTCASVPLGTTDEELRLVVVELDTGRATPLPGARAGDHSGVWSPDGGRLAFVTERTGTSQLAVCGLTGVDATVVTSMSAGVVGPASWSSDGRRVVVAARRGRAVDRSLPWRITRPVAWADGLGALDDPPQLWVCDVDGGTSEMVTDDEWRWSLPRWSPDGRTIAARASFDPTGNRRGQHVRLVDIGDGVDVGTWRAPAVPGGSAAVPAWAADGSLLVLSFQPEGRPVGSEAQLHRVQADGTVTRLDTGAPMPLGGTVYGDSPAAVGEAFEHALVVHGTDVYVRTQRGGRMGVAVLDLDRGAWAEVVGGERCASPIGVGGGGLVVAEQSAERWCTLAVVPVGDGAAGRQLSLISDADPPLPATATVHRWTVASPHDGAPLEAWHLRPAGVEGPLPTVLLIHGGPNAAFGECFLLDAQALCAAGFGVVYTNPHGSTGSGDDFTHSVFDHWGDIPVLDVFAVLDDAVVRGWVDGDRVGVTGNSYGGYLTSWLACTTDRFRAAVAENPVTDLVSMWGTSDIGVTFLPMQLGTSPLDDLAPYLRWSPLLRAAGCRTPMLFVVGADDRRCPPSQAFELHRTLRALGRTSEVLMLPGAAHEGSTYGPPAVRFAHDAALVEWMQRWLGAAP